jgi:putative ABC transport system substrate-binding protein
MDLSGELVGMRRREFITLLGGAAVGWSLSARAQTDQMRRIGALMAYAASDPEGQSRGAAFEQGLKGLGWADGHNLRIEYRWPGDDVDRIRTFAKELVGMAPDAILGGATPAVTALQRATRTIPIVFAGVTDPVGQGIVESLAHPGGNLTGFTNFEFSLGGKWLELLKEIAPHVRRVALMFNPETAPAASLYLRSVEAVAPSFAVELTGTPVHDEAEMERAMASLAREPLGGLIVLPDIFTISHRKLTIALAARHRLPAIYSLSYFARDGGLVSYGIDTVDQYRGAALYVDRILKGAKPADLPVQAPNKFELVINLKLARADEVIE